MHKLITILSAIGAVGFFVPTLKSVIKGEPINAAFLVLSLSLLANSLVFLVVGAAAARKSGDGSGPPSA